MQLIRGTTPSIEITVQTEIDLHDVAQVWIYISQQGKVKIDKDMSDVVSFDYANNKITVRFSQDDTLGLKAGDALFQMRLLLEDDTALACVAQEVEIIEIYKPGVITEEE